VGNTRLDDYFISGKGDWRARWYKWEEILREAENNPALDDLIKKAEMVYALTK
jgi:hypothetical protein